VNKLNASEEDHLSYRYGIVKHYHFLIHNERNYYHLDYFHRGMTILEEHACQCQEQVRCNALEYFNCCKDDIVTVTTKIQDSHLLEMYLTEVDSFPLF
jgi:hypothetical protein